MEASAPVVLIVDDESSARLTTEALLLRDGFTLRFAESGAEALRTLEEGHVDLVLCDVMMPGMDGFEVCRRMKAHEQWSTVPVIMVTALDGDEEMIQGLEAGADDFISKPVVGPVLRARVRAMLRVRARYEHLRAAAPDLETLIRRRRDRLADAAKLSEREREILDLLLLGRNHLEIGAALGISPRTSKFHQGNVLEKLGADSRLDLMRLFL
ncbi:MAG: response regulator [Myxococcales bacterium]|nr:response regulator [Myxococcales bacterium]